MSYTPINWQNGKTPINATNLNKMDNAIKDLCNAITLDFDDVFTISTDTVSNIAVEGCAISKRGNHIWVDIGFKGSIVSGAGGNTSILKIKSAYTPLRNFSTGVMINGTTNGQIYKSATLYTSAKTNIMVVFPETRTTYGNASYPWSTSSWLKFDWEIA